MRSIISLFVVLLATLSGARLTITPAYAQTCRLDTSISEYELNIPDRSPKSEHSDGTLLMAPYSNRVYVVNYEAVFVIPNEAEFVSMGYQWEAIRVVQSGYLSGIRRSPVDGALLKERDRNAVYAFQGGYRFLVPDETTLGRLGYKGENIRTVPRGALAGTRRAPRPGTLLQEEGSPKIYIMNGNALRWIRTEACFNKLGLDWNRIRTVPKGGLRGIPSGLDIY
jgi:hypothetical protein